MPKRKTRRKTFETDFFGKPVDTVESINQKKKGNRNETVAAKWLTAWTGKDFTRTPSSGGLQWKDMSNVCGDVVCTDENFNFVFSVETKHLKDVSLPATGELRANSKVFTIWEQCSRDAERGNKVPMLMLRRNGMGAGEYVIVLPAVVSEHFGDDAHAISTGVSKTGEALNCYRSSDIQGADYSALADFLVKRKTIA